MAENTKLAGRTALITGAGGAIGGASARLLAAEGANVLVADNRMDAAEATVADIEAAGGKALAYGMDVSDPLEAEAAVARAVEEYSALHILVNVAAAVTPDASVEDMDLDDWNEAFAVNLTGPMLMCKFAVPRIRAAGGGAIVNIASQLGYIGTPLRTAYCTTKAALHHFTRILAHEVAADGIRVNSVSPGVINTPRIMRRWDSVADLQEGRGPNHMLGRVGEAREVARAVLYLASEDASFTTASDLLVDGGYIAFKGRMDDPVRGGPG
ncbi:MAG: SDR family NAD(P)-dependent oxidoreductase [Alphaproteobacteria bacterium]